MSSSLKRILLVDDNKNIHDDFRKIFSVNKDDMLFELEKSKIFPNILPPSKTNRELPTYILDSAFQGEEALKLIKIALDDGQPYALAFVDIRMPPGLDGIETVKRIWELDPDIQIVICTAHSDYSWGEISQKLTISDNFLILKKPCDPIEILTLASTMTKKWELKRIVQDQIESLEIAVEKRTIELHNAKEMAEKANRIKTEFLENISHEFRTPLNGVVGFTQLIHSETIVPLHKEYCELILSSANHLLQMIIDILDVSNIEYGEIEFHHESINLEKLMNEIKNFYQHSILEKHIQFDIIMDPKLTPIVLDPTKLKQVILNYVSNAIKFTSDGGKIVIRAYPVNADQFRIEVIDSSFGIQKEDISKIFQVFQQLDSSATKKYAGIGIGLALVKRIVEALGGEVGVESQPGKGSTFFAVMPCKGPAERSVKNSEL